MIISTVNFSGISIWQTLIFSALNDTSGLTFDNRLGASDIQYNVSHWLNLS